ncbi:hypothetical protein L6R52_09550 [Myxococcota bacterium]|nr:hypothetical protein [Myxococcota bacterium]
MIEKLIELVSGTGAIAVVSWAVLSVGGWMIFDASPRGRPDAPTLLGMLACNAVLAIGIASLWKKLRPARREAEAPEKKEVPESKEAR